MKHETEQIILKSDTPEELLRAMEKLDQEDKLDTMNPHHRREVERAVSQRSIGYSGIRSTYL